MKRLITTVSIIGLATAAPLAISGHTDIPVRTVADPGDPAQITGSISSISEDGSVFEVRTTVGVVSVKVDDKTEFTLNGKEAAKDEALKIGHEVIVFRKGDTATKVDAKSEIEPTLL